MEGWLILPDTGEPPGVMLKYGKTYDGWTGEDVTKHLEEVHAPL